MRIHSIAALGTAAALVLGLTACSSGSTQADDAEGRALVLSDSGVTLDGAEVSQEEGAVTTGHDIVYYQADQGSDYGEGSQDEEHTAEEAEANTVVTIREAGTYRVSGSLSAGQLAVDLGEDAKTDPDAVVTLILDGVDITCTVAPAVIFYNVYECDTDWVAYDSEETEDYTSSPTVDTTQAGANVILADGSENNITGSHVARIYKEGTTKKLHKYDGAFYSKMSMNVSGESEGTGVLNITADNEGLDSELHLTLNGGTVNIQSQDDGINTNEDGVSVTTINGGTLQINAGLGTEGDGIDSNGYLVINGGNVYSMANATSPDGGLDADSDILINGGYVVALGVRNDAVSSESAQPYMELSFASTLPAGSQIALTDGEDGELLSFTTEKTAQSIVFSSPDLALDTAYTLTVDGVVQQYTGNTSGGFGGGPGGPGGDFQPGDMPENAQPPEDGGEPPEKPDGDSQPPQDGQTPPDQSGDNGDRPEPPERPEDEQPGGQPQSGGETTDGEGSTEFTLSETVHSFSGISDSAQDSGKTAVTFSAKVAVSEDGTVSVTDIQADQDVDSGKVQLTVTDVPSEDYSASCLLSDGDAGLESILPTDPGTYRLTIAVTEDDTYTGASQFSFTIPESETDSEE